MVDFLHTFIVSDGTILPLTAVGGLKEQFFTLSLSQPTFLLSARLDPRLLRSGGNISPLQS